MLYRCLPAVILTLVMVCLSPAKAIAGAEDLPGRVVAIWSKGAGSFVRSAGGASGELRADRVSFEANNEGRFICFAEAGGTLAFMNVMQERYVTRVGGQLFAATSGAAAARRFTLEDRGNHFYAIRAGDGTYARVDGTGRLLMDANAVTDAAVFAIVPVRSGPNVVMRVERGDDPLNQLPGYPNEAQQLIQNPADFPVNKVNIGMLQTTPLLHSDAQLTALRTVWNTNGFESEFIMPYVDYSQLSMTAQVDNLIDRIKRMERLGYSFDYVILYHEIIVGLPGGPWSDARLPSQQEIDLFRTRVGQAFARGEVKYPAYKVFVMPYQFTLGGGLIQPGGCDTAALNFIKSNFQGMILEVNGHDYIQDNGAPDAAAAAAWCRDNGLEFGITSGRLNDKDTNFKTMYQAIFTAMANAGVDRSSNKMHYIMHHVYQPYADRLPEWVENTTTQNAKWLIENVMPFEALMISAIDTDGDGVSDLQEAADGSYPLLAGFEPVFDDFSTYAAGNISGQAGTPTGFESGPWFSSGGGTTTTVNGGILTSSGNGFRTHRALNPPVKRGMIYLSANLALSTAAGSYAALELSTAENNGDTNAVRLVGGTTLRIDVQGGGAGVSVSSNNGAMRRWLIELNLDSGAGRAWIVDANASAFNPYTGAQAFSAAPGFLLGAVNIATFAAPSETPSVALDELRIGPSWSSIGITVPPRSASSPAAWCLLE